MRDLKLQNALANSRTRVLGWISSRDPNDTTTTHDDDPREQNPLSYILGQRADTHCALTPNRNHGYAPRRRRRQRAVRRLFCPAPHGLKMLRARLTDGQRLRTRRWRRCPWETSWATSVGSPRAVCAVSSAPTTDREQLWDPGPTRWRTRPCPVSTAAAPSPAGARILTARRRR